MTNIKDVILVKYSDTLKRAYENYPRYLFKDNIIVFFLNLLYSYLRIKVQCKDGYFIFTFDNGVSIKSYYPNLDCRLVAPNSSYRYFKRYDLKKGDIAIDGGAYLGVFALYAAKLVGDSGKVVAFEPDITNYKKLVDNIDLNELENVIAINKGLSNVNATLRFYCVGSSYSSFFSENIESIEKTSVDPNDSRFIEIPVVRLDDELNMLNIRRVDFIKMDIEGAEIDAIAGCNNILKRNNVNLAIATYHIVNGSRTAETIEQLLRESSYNVETTNKEHLTTYGWRKHAKY